ncbi:MAG: phosphoribosyltransferase family protein [Desulfurococcaceae archaeon]
MSNCPRRIIIKEYLNFARFNYINETNSTGNVALGIKTRYATWIDIHEALGKLSSKVMGEFKPQVLIAIAKGGLLPARIIADILGVDEIGFIEVKLYKSIGIRSEKPYIKLIGVPPIMDKDVLVVDDVIDSGRTMQLVIDTLSKYTPRSIKALAIYIKPWSTYVPDYYYARTDEWIVFPWEICESAREGVELDHPEYINISHYCQGRNSN